MKYIDEFRDGEVARRLATAIHQDVDERRSYQLMEFCGGHTHAVFRYGLQDMMPENVNFLHGPGCPVCVLPIGRIDHAIRLVEKHNVMLCSYGDLMRVPASGRNSLLKARAAGADIHMVYSTEDALQLAEANPDRQVVFFAIGFETTTPPTAVAIKMAKKHGLKNFSVFCNHVLTPAAIHHILQSEVGEATLNIDGFIGPSHVSSIIGLKPYRFVAEDYHKPVVIAGFEPLDVMLATRMLIHQINESRTEVENEYARVVTEEGNVKAQALVDEVFELRASFEWRGLGSVPDSALKIRDRFSDFDAELRFPISTAESPDVKGCECPSVLRGVMKPTQCRLFGTVCTPENPMGACMVSSEGACAAYYLFGRHR
jgi:hydrogenase expression/formation protein HypD